jgi:amidophosphoribosyltransferase
MVEWIKKDLDVSTLRYQDVDDMVEAIGLSKEKLCLYCWTGECPKQARPKSAIDIVDVDQAPAKKIRETKIPL